jgi:hypothetical protein
MIDDFPIIRDAFPRTVRLVSTARLRPSVLLDLVSEDEVEALFELEGATSQRLMAQARGSEDLRPEELVYGVPHAAFINAAFSYAKPRGLNRFNGAGRGAWYAALDVETCLAEITYHHTKFLEDAGVFQGTIEYAEIFASLAGEFIDLRDKSELDCLHPNETIGYPAGNAVADAARAKGLNGIIYPSVRHADGTCFAVLFPHAVQSVAQGDVYRMSWTGSATPKIQRV